MNRFLTMIFVALCLTACGNDDEPEARPEISQEVRELWSSLKGTYTTTFELMNTGKVWYTETITFKPYNEPKKIVPPFTSKRGDIYAYGTADIEDTRFTSISGTSRCYYCFGTSATGKTTVTFYKYADDNGDGWGSEDERSIRLLSSDSFQMWPYGTSEAENIQTYTRQ